MGRLTVLKPRVDAAPPSRLAESGAQVGHERQLTGRPWRRKRSRILTRDCGLCRACRAAGRLKLATDIDHIVPVWKGGTDEDDNLQSLCGPCHDAKTAREATERAST